jgi:hypothetical protein
MDVQIFIFIYFYAELGIFLQGNRRESTHTPELATSPSQQGDHMSFDDQRYGHLRLHRVIVPPVGACVSSPNIFCEVT